MPASSATTHTLRDGSASDKTAAASRLCALPQELRLEILRHAGAPTGMISISGNGEERVVLSGDSKGFSTVCKTLQHDMRVLGTSRVSRAGMTKTHVYRGGYKYFFNLDRATHVQSRIDTLADAFAANPLNTCAEYTKFYPLGWGLEHYETFVNSSKNEIDVLVIPTARSDDFRASESHARGAAIGLREVSYWIQRTRRLGVRLLPNLSRIVAGEDAGEVEVGEDALDEVFTRASPPGSGCTHPTPAIQLRYLAQSLAISLNDARAHALYQGPRIEVKVAAKH